MIIVTCVDPGSANYLVPILINFQGNKSIYSSGSATHIFRSAGIITNEIETSNWDELQNIANSIILTSDSDLVLCGTSWGLSLDKAITLAAKDAGITTVSTVDHWRLIKERFINFENINDKDTLTFLTDYIIVIDEKSKYVLKSFGVDSDHILVGGNPHLESINNRYSNIINEILDEDLNKKNVLFISEIIRDDLPNHYYDEYKVLKDLLTLSNSFGLNIDIKLHPNEEYNKYSDFVPTSTVVKADIDFSKMILEYEYIIGMDSMLLFELSMCRSGVFSYRPNFLDMNDNLFSESSVVSIYEYKDLKRVFKNELVNMQYKKYSYRGSCSKVLHHIYNLMENK